MSTSPPPEKSIQNCSIPFITLLILILLSLRLSTAQRVGGSSILQQIVDRQNQNRGGSRRNPNGNQQGGQQHGRNRNVELSTSTTIPIETTQTTDLPG